MWILTGLENQSLIFSLWKIKTTKTTKICVSINLKTKPEKQCSRNLLLWKILDYNDDCTVLGKKIRPSIPCFHKSETLHVLIKLD